MSHSVRISCASRYWYHGQTSLAKLTGLIPYARVGWGGTEKDFWIYETADLLTLDFTELSYFL